jgi:AmiR/NasT family two-component response regulator
LNVWSREPAGFNPVETALLAMFCSAASAIITTAAHWADARATAKDLLAALETRDTIATAKGIVMARRGLNPDEAFRWLTDISQRTNRKIREVAALIVADPTVVTRSG